MQGELYLHGLSVLDQNGPQLSIELEEDLPLSRPVQVSYGQGFDVQRLAPLQLHLQENVEAQGWGAGGRGVAPDQAPGESLHLGSQLLNL